LIPLKDNSLWMDDANLNLKYWWICRPGYGTKMNSATHYLILTCLLSCTVHASTPLSTLKHKISSLFPKKSDKGAHSTPSNHYGPLPQDQLSSKERISTEKDKLLWQICERVKTSDDYDGERVNLMRHRLLPEFLVYGKDEVVVKEVFRVSPFGPYIDDKNILKALHLSLQNDRHARFVFLLESTRERCTKEDIRRGTQAHFLSSELFMDEFFKDFSLSSDGMPIKRLLTLHGHAFRTRYPEAFELFCESLICRLRGRFKQDLRMKKMLIDFVGQPSLLTETIFVRTFLGYYSMFYDSGRRDFIKHGWREAIEEGLKEEYLSGGKKLWRVITKMFPGQFPKDYPPSPAVLKTALEKFRSKQEIEEEWVKMNVLPFQRTLLVKLDESVGTILPKVLMKIVVEYGTGCTWIDIPDAQ
jgi:hypothetical protein